MHHSSSRGRARRMLQALLAATDPLGVVDAGASAAVYDRTVAAALTALESGGCVRTVALGFLLPHAPAAAGPRVQRAAERFAAAADDWWRTEHLRVPVTPAVAAAARGADRTVDPTSDRSPGHTGECMPERAGDHTRDRAGDRRGNGPATAAGRRAAS